MPFRLLIFLAQESWISEVRTRVLKELQASNPYGKEYTRIVELVLEHEKNWVRGLLMDVRID
jgi:hypothetical protein